MEHVCPICNKPTKIIRDEFDEYDAIYEHGYQDYACNSHSDHHVYVCCVINDLIVREQVRLYENGIPLNINVSYEQNKTELWAGFHRGARVKIDRLFIPDFSDLDKLKEKIKFYLLVS